MLDRVRASQRVLIQMAALGRRQMSKKASRFKQKGEKPSKSTEGQGEVGSESSNVTHVPPASAVKADPVAASVDASSAKAAGESSLSQAERAFIGVGALICGGIGYYAWTHRKAPSPVESNLSGEGSIVLPTPNKLDTDISGAEHVLQSKITSDESARNLESNVSSPPNVADLQGPGEARSSEDVSAQGAPSDPEISDKSDEEGDPLLQVESATNEETVTIDPSPVNELFVEALGFNVVDTREDELSKEPLQGAEPHETRDSGSSSAKAVPPPLKTQRSLEEHLEYSEEVGMITQALIDEAITSRDAPWTSEEWKHVHQQAQSDALYFIGWRKHLQENFQLETDAQKSKIKEITAKLLRSEDAKAAYKEEMTKLMEEQETVLNNLKEKELEKQAAFLSVAASEAAVKERVERAKALDEIRLKANALSVALDQRTKEAKTGQFTNKIAEGALALSMCLEHGLPCQSLVSALRTSCGNDSLVSKVLNSLSDEMSTKGVPTTLQLSNTYKEVKADLLAMGMLPSTGGGVLAQMVAKFGAWLQVSEAGHGRPSTVASGLSCADAHLVNGDVYLAADQVEKATSGTAAAVLAQKWVIDAKNRAIAEQAIKLLQARATCLTASLA